MKRDLACLILLLWVVVFSANCGGDDPDDKSDDDDDDAVATDDDDNDDDTDAKGSFLSYTYTFSCTDCPDEEEGYEKHVTFSDSGSFSTGEWAPIHCTRNSQSVDVYASNKEYGEDCMEDMVNIEIWSDIYQGPDTYEYSCRCGEDESHSIDCENEGYVALTTHILHDGECYNTDYGEAPSDVGRIFYQEYGPTINCSYSYDPSEQHESGSIGCSVQIDVHNESKLSGTFSCYQTLEASKQRIYKREDTWNTKTDLRVEGEFQCIFEDETEED